MFEEILNWVKPLTSKFSLSKKKMGDTGENIIPSYDYDFYLAFDSNSDTPHPTHVPLFSDRFFKRDTWSPVGHFSEMSARFMHNIK